MTQAIWKQALHNPDPDKRKLFDALHTYVLIDKARQNGYEVTLLYVAVNSVKTAIKRVNKRVELNGRGVEPELIKKG